VLLLKTYVDTHLPLIHSVIKNGKLVGDWKCQFDPDRIVPCFEGSLPDITALLSRCTVWGAAKDQQQLLVRLLKKAMFQLRCFVRWLAQMTIQIYKLQQEAYDKTLPVGPLKTAAAARARKVASLAKKNHTSTKSKVYRAVECEKIPESDDILEYLRRVVLCTLLGNYKHAHVFVEYRYRLKLYEQFDWEVDRFEFLNWIHDREGVEFYALKENVAFAMQSNTAMLAVMRDISRWDAYTHSTKEGCDRIIRHTLNQYGFDSKQYLPELDDKPNPDLYSVDAPSDTFMTSSRKGLDRLRRKQLLDAERKTKPSFTEFARSMLKHGKNAAAIQERLKLIPPDKDQILRAVIPRMPPENGADWFILIGFGLSEQSMMILLRIEDAYSGILSESDLHKHHLPNLSPYAWACAYKFFDGFEQCYSIRLFEAPASWYEMHINALRLRYHVPPGRPLPPNAGLLLYCPSCNHVRNDILPPGTGTEQDMTTEISVSNGRVSNTPAPKNKRKRKKQPSIETASHAYKQAAMGFTKVMVDCTPTGMRYYCIGNKDKHKQSQKQGGAPMCGQMPLMMFDMTGMFFQFNNHCTTLCCMCANHVVFDSRYQSGDRYLCKFCQRSVNLQRDLEKKRNAILHDRLDQTKEERRIVLGQVRTTSIFAGLKEATMIEDELKVIQKLDARIEDLRQKIPALPSLGPLWPLFPSKHKRIGANELPTVAIELKAQEIEYICSYCGIRNTASSDKPPATYTLYGGVEFTLCHQHNKHCIVSRANRSRDFAPEDYLELIRRQIRLDRAHLFQGKWHDHTPTWSVEPYVHRLAALKKYLHEHKTLGDRTTNRQKLKMILRKDIQDKHKQGQADEIKLQILDVHRMNKMQCYLDCSENAAVAKACEYGRRGNVCLKSSAVPDWDFLPEFNLVPERMYHCHSSQAWHIWGDMDSQEKLDLAWKICDEEFADHAVCDFCETERVVRANKIMAPSTVVKVELFMCCHGHLFGKVALLISKS